MSGENGPTPLTPAFWRRSGAGPPVRSLLVTVAILSLGLVIVTVANYRTAVQVAEETLRNQGMRIGLELAAEARARGAWEGPMLQPLVAEQHRRAIAFLAVVDREGTILAHTNPRLLGSLLEDPAFALVRKTGQLTGEMVPLGTGEEVYALTMPFHVPAGGPGSVSVSDQPRFRILRLALHTSPARQIVHHALIQVVLVGVMVAILLGLSLWQIRTLRRYLRLHGEAARQERLAALGGMAAVLAHEIRNPLGAIKGLAQFLGEKTGGDPTQAEMTETIAREATRLERLVNDLLAYARPRPPDRQTVELVPILRRVLALAQPAAAEAGVALRLEADSDLFPVSADPEQMQQLFGNLVLNALQSTPHGGTVRLTAASAFPTTGRPFPPAGKPGWLEVSVEDTGHGISAAELPRIFEPFFTTRAKGTGLGLAICRQIVEAHGGTIRAASMDAQGARLTITLPVEGPARA